MIFPEGVYTFGVLLLVYVGFISWKMGVWPWELMRAEYHREKKAKDE